MAKFCKFCGASLEEGQVCNCAGAQAAAQATAPAEASAAASAAAPSKAKGLFDELKNIVLTTLKSPSQASAAVTGSANKLPLAGILAGVNGIVIWLLLWRILASLVGTLMGSALGEYASMGAAVDISYPIFPMLLSGIVIAALFIGLCGAALFVFTKLCKKEMAILDAIIVAASNTVIPSALLLAALILSFLSLKIALIFVVLAMWVFFLSMSEVSRERTGIVATRTIKNLGIVVGVRLVAIGLAIFLSYKLIGWSISELAIAGMKLGDAMDMLGSLGSLTDILGG